MSEVFDTREENAQLSDDGAPDRRSGQRRRGGDRRRTRRDVFDRRCGFDRRSHPFYAPRRPQLGCVPVVGPWVHDQADDDVHVRGILNEIEDIFGTLRRKRPEETQTQLWREAVNRLFGGYERLT